MTSVQTQTDLTAAPQETTDEQAEFNVVSMGEERVLKYIKYFDQIDMDNTEYAQNFNRFCIQIAKRGTEKALKALAAFECEKKDGKPYRSIPSEAQTALVHTNSDGVISALFKRKKIAADAQQALFKKTKHKNRLAKHADIIEELQIKIAKKELIRGQRLQAQEANTNTIERKKALAANPSICQAAQDILIDLDDADLAIIKKSGDKEKPEELLVILAKNKNASKASFVKMAEKGTLNVLKALAQRPDLPDEATLKILERIDPLVAEAINEETRKLDKAKISKTKTKTDKRIETAEEKAKENIYVLYRLLVDEQESLSTKAQETIATKGTDTARIRLLERNNTPSIINLIGEHGGQRVRLKMAGMDNLSDNLQLTFVKSNDKDVIDEILKRKKIASNTQIELATHADKGIRVKIAGHKGTEEDIQIALAQDSEPEVRDALKANEARTEKASNALRTYERQGYAQAFSDVGLPVPENF